MWSHLDVGNEVPRMKQNKTQQASTEQDMTAHNRTLHDTFLEKRNKRKGNYTMAEKPTKGTENFIALENIKISKLIVSLAGDGEVILCKKARSYEREEIFKQSHPKGTKIPSEYQQPYCLWEKLITSIHWLYPITFHDDDYSKYTEEEWRHYMNPEVNKPCILGKAFQDSLKEAFISCGFKESTGKAGTDFKRTISFKTLTPISFALAGYDQHLAQTSGLSRTNVLTQQNVFSGWRCDVEVDYLEAAFPKETILQLFQTAGACIGIGARRSEGYGRYHIESTAYVE